MAHNKGVKKVLFSDEVTQTWSKVLDDDDSTNWMVLEFGKGKHRARISVAHSGMGGLPHLKVFLEDDKVQFVGLRATVVEETAAEGATTAAALRKQRNDLLTLAKNVSVKRGDAASLRPRFINFAWFGPKAPSIQKARRANQVPEVFHKMPNTCCSWTAYEASDISDDHFAEKLKVKGQSHVSIDFENKRLMGKMGLTVVAVPASREEAIKLQAAARRQRRESASARRADAVLFAKLKADAKAVADSEATAKADAAAAQKKAAETAAAAAAALELVKAAEEAKKAAAAAEAEAKAKAEVKAKAEAVSQAFHLKLEAEAKAKAELEVAAAAAAAAAATTAAASKEETKTTSAAAQLRQQRKDLLAGKTVAKEDKKTTFTETASQAHVRKLRQMSLHGEADAAAAAAVVADAAAAKEEKKAKAAAQTKARKLRQMSVYSEERVALPGMVKMAISEEKKCYDAAPPSAPDSATENGATKEAAAVWVEPARAAMIQSLGEMVCEIGKEKITMSILRRRPAAGTLKITVVQGKLTATKQHNSPYFVAKVHGGPADSKVPSSHTSSHAAGTDTPLWKEECLFVVTNADVASVEVKVFSKVVLSKLIGTIEPFALTELFQKLADSSPDANYLGFDTGVGSHKIFDNHGLDVGSVELGISWFPHNGKFFRDVTQNVDRLAASVEALKAKLAEDGVSKEQLEEIVKNKSTEANKQANQFELSSSELASPYGPNKGKQVYGWRQKRDMRLAASKAAFDARKGGVRDTTLVTVTNKRDQRIGLNFGHEEWDTVVVTSVKTECSSHAHGVRAMWTLASLGGMPCKTFKDAKKALQSLPKEKTTFEMAFSPSISMAFDDFWPGVTHDPKTSILSRDADDTFYGSRTVIGGHVLTEGVHAWNVEIIDGGKNMSIRMGICDAEDINPNVPAGDDKYCWAYDCRGYVVHNQKQNIFGEAEYQSAKQKKRTAASKSGVELKHQLNKLKKGDSCTLICDMTNGFFVMDFWSVGGSITYLYRKLQGKTKGKHLSPCFSFGSPGQKIKITTAKLA